MASRFQAIERDLTWYYNHSCSIANMKSGYSAFISRLSGVNIIASPSDFEPSDAQLTAIRRNRRIYQTLNTLPSNYRSCLYATYSQEYRYPVELINIFGIKTGALLCSCILPTDFLVKLCKKIRQMKLTTAEKQLVFLIRRDADKLFHEAHEAYIGGKP